MIIKPTMRNITHLLQGLQNNILIIIIKEGAKMLPLFLFIKYWLVFELVLDEKKTLLQKP